MFYPAKAELGEQVIKIESSDLTFIVQNNISSSYLSLKFKIGCNSILFDIIIAQLEPKLNSKTGLNQAPPPHQHHHKLF